MLANPTSAADVAVANPSVPTAVRRTAATTAERGPRAERKLSTARFDLMVILASAWFVGGLYLDGWAHNNIPSLETFFTPWHAVLYSGFLVSVAVLGWGIGRNRAAGYSWWRAIPAGYEAAVLGAGLFAAAAVADMAWHIAFGIEADIDALLSPTHLLLLLGGSLLLAAPIRASQRRMQAGVTEGGSLAQLPRVLAMTFLLLSIAFFTQYANPWGGPWLTSANRPITPLVPTAGGRGMEAVFLFQAVTIAGILLQAVVLSGFVAVALRQGLLPMGSLTLMIGLYVVLTVLMRQKYDAGFQLHLAVAGLAAGALADVLYARLRAALDRPLAYQAFLTLVPALATAACLGALALAQGTWWSVHLWSGAVVLAGGAGWLVSLVTGPGQAKSTLAAA